MLSLAPRTTTQDLCHCWEEIIFLVVIATHQIIIPLFLLLNKRHSEVSARDFQKMAFLWATHREKGRSYDSHMGTTDFSCPLAPRSRPWRHPIDKFLCNVGWNTIYPRFLQLWLPLCCCFNFYGAFTRKRWYLHTLGKLDFREWINVEESF